MHFEIETRPEMRVGTVRHVGPYPRISAAFARLGQIAGPAGLIREGSSMLAIYHDDPETVSEAELRSDAAIEVTRDVSLPGTLQELTLAPGRYARTTHVGPYKQLGDVWAQFLAQWLPESGERVGEGGWFEIYRNHPGIAKPEEVRTELYIPLA